jgi:DnaJ-class molecular chaperone|tara:strand:+ start:725 stop:925 length:201 start_codon:yes stop_codon:yes gene_type:complete
MDTKLETCNNCKGNGYVRTHDIDLTSTCVECGGAGYFGNLSKNQNSRPTDNNLTEMVSDDDDTKNS